MTQIAAETESHEVDLSAKNVHAAVIRRLLEERGVAAGLDEQGITQKVVRRDADGDPIEKMTFRNFNHESFPRETWEDSDLRAETRRILFVVFDSARGEPVEDAVLAGAFFWSPSEDEDRVICRDWRRAREAVTYKLVAPRETDTAAVHVATKGRDSDDLEEGATGAKYRKECLAFNKLFVAGIVAAGMGRTPAGS